MSHRRITKVTALALTALSLSLTSRVPAQGLEKTAPPDVAVRAAETEKAAAGSKLREAFMRPEAERGLKSKMTQLPGAGYERPPQVSSDARKSWARRNWWVFPLVAGAVVGIAFAASGSNGSPGEPDVIGGTAPPLFR